MKRTLLFSITTCIALASFILGGCSKKEEPHHSKKRVAFVATLPSSEPDDFTKKVWELNDYILSYELGRKEFYHLRVTNGGTNTTTLIGSIHSDIPVDTPLALLYPPSYDVDTSTVILILGFQEVMRSREELRPRKYEYMWASGSYKGEAPDTVTFKRLVSL
ncbi:MAG: hypothetical protein ACRCZZ_10330, partial [Phocaeicola sp.]